MRRLLTAVLLAFATSLPAQKLELKRGQKLVFLGDSITHQGYWVSALESWLFAARPELELQFFNAGIGGDRAAQAQARVPYEVIAQKPDVVMVLLGMNDGGYRQQDPELLRTFEQGMQAIVADVAKTGATLVVLGPSYFDTTARANKNDPMIATHEYYNDVLLQLEKTAKSVAGKHRFVELNAPMAELTRAQRQAQADFTLVPDGIHPNAAGGFVMAVTILRALVGESPPVVIEMTPPGDEERSETITEWRRIPCPVPAAAEPLRAKLDFDQHFNRFTLRANGAPRGRYRLTADELELGVFTSEELAAGIDLLRFAEAPWNQRAAKLGELAEHRRQFIAGAIRNKVGQIKDLKDDAERAARYQAIHAELAEEWAKVRTVEDEMRTLAKRFTVKFVLERRAE